MQVWLANSVVPQFLADKLISKHLILNIFSALICLASELYAPQPSSTVFQCIQTQWILSHFCHLRFNNGPCCSMLVVTWARNVEKWYVAGAGNAVCSMSRRVTCLSGNSWSNNKLYNIILELFMHVLFFSHLRCRNNVFSSLLLPDSPCSAAAATAARAIVLFSFLDVSSTKDFKYEKNVCSASVEYSGYFHVLSPAFSALRRIAQKYSYIFNEYPRKRSAIGGADVDMRSPLNHCYV